MSLRGLSWLLSCAIALGLLSATSVASPVSGRSSECRKTKVAILGAGTAGITAGQALANQSIDDFLIVEYNGDIGGRVAHTEFGVDADGKPYTVELGANWVQGLVTDDGPENPIWTLAKKYDLANTYSNYSNITTYTEKGAVDYVSLFDDFEDAYAIVEQDAGQILLQNLQDRSFRAGLRLADWVPKQDMEAQAVEWFEMDWEYSFSPLESSQEFLITNYNQTFYQYSDENNYVYDQRGFNTFIKGEAATYLKENDPRLLLNTVVTNVSWTDDNVTVYNEDGSCIVADYAICTFSLGVLQYDEVAFDPPLPSWKQTSLAAFEMGTYTKIFLQFPSNSTPFWDTNTQFFLYADPAQRGYYPILQSLDGPGFIPDSKILFVTVVNDQSYRAEGQSDEETEAEVMAVLRRMFPGEGVVPDPVAFMYPRWTEMPWAHGSYSNWPPGTTLEMHQNLRANLGRLWFAGEHTSAPYFGFLHGAWFEGQSAGMAIGACVRGEDAEGGCLGGERTYDVLHGTTPLSQYVASNDWTVTSFQTNGFE
ncbi:MAG: chorismate mutase aro7 [Chaenotheca gracillima]|nr:MAG: chorismate mutase aro7 [Chaenotheca gracillima]